MNSASHAKDWEPRGEWARGKVMKEVDSQPVPLRESGGIASLETVRADPKGMCRGEDGSNGAQEGQGGDCELMHGEEVIYVSWGKEVIPCEEPIGVAWCGLISEQW